MNQFTTPITEGNHKPWTYFATIFLVLSGIIGFGNLPLQIALYRRGIASEDMEKLTAEDISTMFSSNDTFIYLIFPFLIGFAMLLLAFRLIHRRPILSFLTSRPAFDLKRFLVGFGVCAVLFGGLFLVELSQPGNHLQWNYSPDEFFFLLLICILLVPLQTGLEEVFFRGYLLQLFGRFTSRGLMIILSNGILFGALHLGNPELVKLGWIVMLYYVLSGCFAALITIMDDGLELSWGFHTANNFMAVLIVTSNWQVFRTEALFIDTSEPSFGWGMYLTLFGFYPLMVFVFARIYKWSGWKQRLLGNEQIR